jgi:hypothetical protein
VLELKITKAKKKEKEKHAECTLRSATYRASDEYLGG